MKFLLLNQFYPPDLAPTGVFLADLTAALARRGHEVRVVASRRRYAAGEAPETPAEPGVEVVRVGGTGFGRRSRAGRVADALTFAAAAGRRALGGPRPDVVVSLTSPPFLGLLARGVAAARRAACVHWTMDLYPDALVAAGLIAAGSRMRGLLETLARSQYRSAALVLALGPCAQARLGRLLQAGTRSEWVALWGRTRSPDPARREAERARLGWRPGETVLLYSGNMGLGHRFEDLLQAAVRTRGSGLVWVFAGGGARRAEIESFAARHPGLRLELLDYVSEERLAARFEAADVHLVCLAPGWQGVVVPSKLAAGFAVGRPALYVGPPEAEPGLWIARSGGGWQAAPGDAAGLLAALDEARSAEERGRRGAAARAFARDHFDRDRGTARLAELLEGCVPAAPGGASR